MNTTVFLDEFRPFRRGEIALARRAVDDPLFLHPPRLDALRYAIRLAQISSLGSEPDELVDRIGSYRLRLLQLLAPVLPTDPARIDPWKLDSRIAKVGRLVESARSRIVDGQLASAERLDAEISRKHLVLVLGGAAGSGYVFLGALTRLQEMGIFPSYLAGCSVGSILSVIRARRRDFDLEELFEDVRQIRRKGVFRAPNLAPRFGLPAALRIDLRTALGELFADDKGRPLALGDLAIPVDVLATGLGPGALSESRDVYARVIDADLHGAAQLPELRGSVLARLVSSLVSLAMSRRVFVPVFLGSDAETAELPALDAAGFSSAIPGLLHYDVPTADPAAAILETLFERHQLVGLVDGALTTLMPARYVWEAIEGGRIGSRHCAIVALDAIARPRGSNAMLAPVLRAISSTAERDKPFWDLHVSFRNAPPFLDLFPSEGRLRRAQSTGQREFAETAALLEKLLAPTPPWKELAPHVVGPSPD